MRYSGRLRAFWNSDSGQNYILIPANSVEQSSDEGSCFSNQSTDAIDDGNLWTQSNSWYSVVVGSYSNFKNLECKLLI